MRPSTRPEGTGLIVAAGCVQLERLARQAAWWRSSRLVSAATIVQLVILVPLVAPVVPQSSMAALRLDELRSDYAETAGWEQLVAQVADAYRSLPTAEQEKAVILASSYGEAGPINHFGAGIGLPRALSPQLTYWYWKPSHVEAQTAVAVGVDPSTMRRFFADVTQVGTIATVDGVHNIERGKPVLICRQPVMPFDEAWASVRNFS